MRTVPMASTSSEANQSRKPVRGNGAVGPRTSGGDSPVSALPTASPPGLVVEIAIRASPFRTGNGAGPACADPAPSPRRWLTLRLELRWQRQGREVLREDLLVRPVRDDRRQRGVDGGLQGVV